MPVIITTESKACTRYANHPLMRQYGALTFFDIETMGLSPQKNPVILCGIMTLTTTHLEVTQLFCQSPEDEREMLLELSTRCPETAVLLTYNGASFDIPYINARMKKLGIPHQLPKTSVIDMLQWARKALPDLSTYTLKTIERVLGIHRDDPFSGAECVEKYNRYLRTGTEELMLEICRHNYEDVLNMAPLLALYDLLLDRKFPMQLPQHILIAGNIYWLAPADVRNQRMILSGSSRNTASLPISLHCGGATLELDQHDLRAYLPVLQFDYPAKNSLYLDCDAIPGYTAMSFNEHTLQEKSGFLLRTNNSDLTASLSSALSKLMALA